MGWKASTIIINEPTNTDHFQLLEKLGFTSLRKIDDRPFEVVMNLEDNEVYIGTYKNNLLICTQELPMQFFENHETAAESTLMNLFPLSEICSIVLHSTVNLWGYAILKEGKKIRARAGSADDGTFIESGEPLEEEKEILSKSTLNRQGERTYLFEGDDEAMTEDQVGENFVFAVCKRYFGEELDSADELLFETHLKGYSYGKASGLKKAGQSKSSGHNKSWWKFW